MSIHLNGSRSASLAQQWGNVGQEVSLPSGKKARLREPDVMLMLRAKMPQEFIQGAMQGAADNSPGAAAKREREQQATIQRFMSDPTKLGDLSKMLDDIAVLYFIEPKLTHVAAEQDVERGVVWVGNVAADDKLWVFANYATGKGAADEGASFRQSIAGRAAAGVEPAQPGESVRAAAE